MGQKTQFGKIPTIRITVFFLIACFSIFRNSLARASTDHLDFIYTYEVATEPLTTEKVWDLDPAVLNPHLERWLTQRQTVLGGLEAIPKGRRGYSVKAAGISTSVRGFVRKPGPWFQSLSEFGCEKEPNAWFSTQEGAQFAASRAAIYWSKILQQKKSQLALLFERVSAESKDLALKQGKKIFVLWLANSEGEWRDQMTQKLRREEWKFYLDEASAQGICQKKNRKPSTPPTWRSMMEPVSQAPPYELSQILARAPARLWNGLFSVRLNVNVAGKILNGKFLIDSSAKKSMMSPSWLEAQGVDPAWLIIPGSLPLRVVWGDLWESESALARVAAVDSIDMSGLKVPLTEFLLYDTEFFSPPENVGTCCDGVLGIDFLRHYPMELRSGVPSEVRVWPKENFHAPEGTPWIEVMHSPRGDLVSSCIATPQKASDLNFLGARWDTGEENALVIHTPWQKRASKASSSGWDIQCGPIQAAENVHASFPRPPKGESDGGLMTTRVPAVTVGIPVMTAGESFIFDLPHGRLWLSSGPRLHQKGKLNRSGLKLKYTLAHGERELHVKEIRAHSAAQSLIRAGLTVGTMITQIDGKPAEDIDEWEVERRLAGDYGDVVTLQWKTKRGLKMAPFQIR
jgi:hypothetical protein